VQQRQSRSPIPCHSAQRGEGRRRQAPKLYRLATREHYEMVTRRTDADSLSTENVADLSSRWGASGPAVTEPQRLKRRTGLVNTVLHPLPPSRPRDGAIEWSKGCRTETRGSRQNMRMRSFKDVAKQLV
jgi:hypothetical protein